MKRTEVIERLKAGDEIIFDKSPRFFGAHFKRNPSAAWKTEIVRVDTVLRLIRDGMVNVRKSATAYDISYLTWKGET